MDEKVTKLWITTFFWGGGGQNAPPNFQVVSSFRAALSIRSAPSILHASECSWSVLLMDMQKTHVVRIQHLVIQLLSGDDQRTTVAHTKTVAQ